jgi:hypothetical protein
MGPTPVISSLKEKMAMLIVLSQLLLLMLIEPEPAPMELVALYK